MKPTLDEALVVIANLVGTHTIKKATRTSAQLRFDAWRAASDLLKRAAAPDTENDKVLRELRESPSVQQVAAASVKVHECLLEFGYPSFDRLTLAQVRHIAHVALFTKRPPSRFAGEETK